jgi:hypothetical protein
MFTDLTNTFYNDAGEANILIFLAHNLRGFPIKS